MTCETTNLADELTAARRQRDGLEERLQRTDARVTHLNTVITETERERDRYKAGLEAAEARLAAAMVQRDGNAFRAATHADTLMQILLLLDTIKDGPVRERIANVILHGRNAIADRQPTGLPLRLRPAVPTADAEPATVAAMHFHVGRSRVGNQIEQQCPCPLVPCGLVLDIDAEPACPHHGRWADKAIQQMHPADHCPAVQPATAGV